MLARPSGIVTLLTDFGWSDPYVGIVKGALLRAAPRLVVVDVAHGVPPQDVEVGAFHAFATIGRFPNGTVHVAVVDPGVGTERRLLAVAAHDCYWLAPDNGLLGPVLRTAPAADVRAVDAAHLGLVPEVATFHGRDVLAPVAAWLASGRYGFSALGPRITDPNVEDVVFAGEPRVVHIDHFGNLVTNLRISAAGGSHGVRIAGRDVPLRTTYGDVAPGEPLAYVGSFGVVEVGVRGGSAAQHFAVGRGAKVALLD